MNQGFLEILRQRNRACACSQLKEVYEQRRKTEALKAKCDFYQRESDLENPREDDRKFLEDYRDAAVDFQKSVRAYSQIIEQKALLGLVRLVLHDEEKRISLRQISLAEAQRLFGGSKLLITVHCSACNQQIDILSSS